MKIGNQELISELHYYCSGDTFLSMLKNKKLWLTDLSSSNDSKEGLWALSQYLEKFPRSRDGFTRRRGAKFVLETAVEDRHSLGMCFSAEDDLLSQWRGYAANGAGVCITFSRAGLQETVAYEAKDKQLDSFGLFPVSYERIETLNLPTEIYSAFQKRFEDYEEGEDGRASLSWSETPASIQADTGVVSKLFRVKNPAFREEQEWRMLLVDKAGRLPGVEYRESGGVISPKLEIDFDLSSIVRVRLGPRNPNKPRHIARVLEAHGCRAGAERSSASYVVPGQQK